MTPPDATNTNAGPAIEVTPTRSQRTIATVREWLPSEERTIEVRVRRNSRNETQVYTVDTRDVVFVPMHPTIDVSGVDSLPSMSDDAVEVWWGVIDSYDRAAETFVAELYPVDRQHENVRFSTEFRTAQVASDDRGRIEEGAMFTWVSVIDHDTGHSRSWIQFPALDVATEEELAEEERIAHEWFQRHGLGPDETPRG